MSQSEPSEEKQKMLRGELYHAFVPELTRDRYICSQKVHRFNTAGDATRRQSVEMWRDIIGDKTPLPPALSNEDEDSSLFENDPWIIPPIRLDYGTNVKVGSSSFINFNAVFLDTCRITIGDRVLVGPNVSFMAGTHPMDPELRNGTKGPELGKEILVEDDCWIGGNVSILPGIKIGRGAVLGACSVITKDVPPFHVVVGNPARIIRKIETKMDSNSRAKISKPETEGPEAAMAQFTRELEVEK